MQFNYEVAISALVSGLVAAIVSGVFQLIARFIDCKLEKKRYFDSKKIDEYFAALDAYATLKDNLRNLGLSMSGHKDPEDCIDPEEKQDMTDRDKKALEAIEGMFSALVNAERITMRLELLGSKRAKSDFSSVKNSIDSYLNCVLEDAQTSGIFRAKTFSSMMEEIDNLLANLTRNAKEDLGL